MAESVSALNLLKANLGFFGTPIDAAMEQYLQSRLEVAAFELHTHCRITLHPGVVADEDLKAMYAAWLYRKSITGEAKPPMLQTAIRNRQIRAAPMEECL